VAQGVYLLTAADAGYDAAKAALAHPLIATFNYDQHNQLLASTDGVGNILAYQNDAHGNRISQTTGAGTADARTVSFGYDKADRTVRQTTGVAA
jgi:YD repeat-containing protein